MKDNKAVSYSFGNRDPEVFVSKAKLAQELQKLCDSGICFFHIPEGKCMMRPEIKILGDSTIRVKHIADNGVTSYFHFILKEATYETLRFS